MSSYRYRKRARLFSSPLQQHTIAAAAGGGGDGGGGGGGGGGGSGGAVGSVGKLAMAGEAGSDSPLEGVTFAFAGAPALVSRARCCSR